MELIEEYLEKIQKVNGTYVLHVPEEVTAAEMDDIYQHWKLNYPEDRLIMLPEDIKIHYRNMYSYYIAMMLVSARHRITRREWSFKYTKKSEAPYLVMDTIEGVEVLIKRWPMGEEDDEFFIVTRDDLEAEDYIISPRGE